MADSVRDNPVWEHWTSLRQDSTKPKVTRPTTPFAPGLWRITPLYSTRVTAAVAGELRRPSEPKIRCGEQVCVPMLPSITHRRIERRWSYVTVDYKRSREDVVSWPTDPRAKRALEDWFIKLGASPPVPPTLAAGETNFSGADLSGLDIVDAEWVSANLSGVKLRSCFLGYAWILDADLTGTDFTGSVLRKALLRGSNGRGAILVGTQLHKADLSGSDFRDADLHDTNLTQAFMPGIDLRGANLANSSWGDGNYNACIHDARLGNANVSGMRGVVDESVDVGLNEPHIIDGDELQQWFRDQGAPEVIVVERPALPQRNA